MDYFICKEMFRMSDEEFKASLATFRPLAHRLEKATLDTIESGVMTKDLALLSEIPVKKTADTEEFISAIAEKL